MQIYQQMQPFVTGMYALKQPNDSVWCVSVCWDILIATVVNIRTGATRSNVSDTSKLLTYDKKYGIYYLTDGFVADLINKNHPREQPDSQLTLGATIKQVEYAVVAKLNTFAKKHAFLYLIDLWEFPVLKSSLIDDAVGQALYPNIVETVGNHKELVFVMLTYTKEESERSGELSHRVIIAGADGKAFAIADPYMGQDPHIVTVKALDSCG